MQKKWTVAACVFAWFATSAVCTASAKAALVKLKHIHTGCALTLTTVQFTLCAIITGLLCLVMGRRPPAALREVLLVSLGYTLGFLLLNIALARLQASFSETVRGLEPLTSFLLARIMAARGAQLSSASAMALLAVLAGAALSVWAQPAFDTGGLAYGLLANCAFSCRGIFVTLLQDAMRRRHAANAVNGPAVDAVGLFFAQHAIGLCLLLPTALASEGTHCAAALTQFHDGCAPLLPATHTYAPRSLARACCAWPGGSTSLAALSATTFFSYNFLSLYVLLLIDAVSHAVCNTCRRAVTIIFAAVVFHNVITPFSATGIALIIGPSRPPHARHTRTRQ